ncbi:glycosyltransferase 87 family protein [Nocardia niigatensis]
MDLAAGALVGLGAGVKLTPAATGLYFTARRQWLAVIWSAVVFAGTIGLTYLLTPRETDRYFGELVGDPHRIGPVGPVIDQSLRGALSRLAGHDIGSGLLWKSSVAVTAVLALFAWRALRSGDRLGTLIIVQLFGSMASPISWSHHWVCLIPLILWLLYGPLREAAGARLMAAYWFVRNGDRRALDAGHAAEVDVGYLASGLPRLAGRGERDRCIGALRLDDPGRAAQP